jgi:hypothetical protein
MCLLITVNNFSWTRLDSLVLKEVSDGYNLFTIDIHLVVGSPQPSCLIPVLFSHLVLKAFKKAKKADQYTVQGY